MTQTQSKLLLYCPGHPGETKVNGKTDATMCPAPHAPSKTREINESEIFK